MPDIYPLGDSAFTLEMGNCIDTALNVRAIAICDWVRGHCFQGMLDVIVAYSSVSVFFDPAKVDDRPAIARLLLEGWRQTAASVVGKDGHLIRIPVCYSAEYGPDLEAVARQKGMSPAEVIDIHCQLPYRIYMIGFLPGFPYMGKLDPRLEVPRKPRPVPVIAGGVGIAALQTGIYPLNSPGGWQIIGRTPVQLFDRCADPPILLCTGDLVQLYPVSVAEFINWKP